jgi:DNA primase
MVLSPFGIARGIVFGDGTANEAGSFGYLVGEKDDELRQWFPLNRITQDSTRADRKVVHNLPKFFKQKPSLDEAAQYLYGWLAGYFAADGCVTEDGTVCINSSVKGNLEFVRDVCTRLGIKTYGITSQLREGFPGREPSLIYRVHLVNDTLTSDFFLLSEHRIRFESCTKKFSRLGWVVQSVEETDMVEEVYCAEVEDGQAFALEDNILTGNCFGCGFTGRAVEFISAYKGKTRTSVAEDILAQYGDEEDLAPSSFDYEDHISPVLLEGSKFLQTLVQKYKHDPEVLGYIDKLIWWLDFYMMSKAPRHINPKDLQARIERTKELLSDEQMFNSR